MPLSAPLPPSAPWLDARLKGYPPSAPPLQRHQIAAQRWNVLAGDLPLPLAVVHRHALAQNLGWMQRHVQAHGIALAPHGKTTMSPELFSAQVDAGAWGITFASVHQLALGVAAGASGGADAAVQRALIANQVVQPSDLRQLAALRAARPGLRAPFFIDSAAQIALIEAEPLGAPLEVLVELGLPGGRTGCRGHDEALALARAAHASPAVMLAGLSTYEGLWGQGDSAADRTLVDGLMQRVHTLVQAMDAEGLFEAPEITVTAGGSAVFDLVSPWLNPASFSASFPPLSRPVLGLLRSGCYVTHDSGHYQRMVHVAHQRLGCADADGLRAALQVWTLVQSVPEPGLAILNAGKRDVGIDMGLPVALRHALRGATTAAPAATHWRITKLNDQHAYLETGTDTLQVGDRVALGISHPCTTFDKWRWMPVVDEAFTVVDAITTMF